MRCLSRRVRGHQISYTAQPNADDRIVDHVRHVDADALILPHDGIVSQHAEAVGTAGNRRLGHLQALDDVGGEELLAGHDRISARRNTSMIVGCDTPQDHAKSIRLSPSSRRLTTSARWCGVSLK